MQCRNCDKPMTFMKISKSPQRYNMKYYECIHCKRRVKEVKQKAKIKSKA